MRARLERGESPHVAVGRHLWGACRRCCRQILPCSRSGCMAVVCSTLVTLLLACVACTVQPVETPPPSPSGAASVGLETHTGLGYTISYPAGARVEVVEPPQRTTPPGRLLWTGVLEWTEIDGPEVEMCRADVGLPHTTRAYRLQIVVYANPEGLDAEAWARRHILDTWRRAQEEGLPTGGAPVEDDVIREDRVGWVAVAGRPAFRASYWRGASEADVYHLASGEYVVTLVQDSWPVENDPLGVAQDHAVYLMLSTLRLE